MNSPATTTLNSQTLVATSGMTSEIEETKTLITSSSAETSNTLNQTDSFTNKSSISVLLTSFNNSTKQSLEESQEQVDQDNDDTEGAPPREVGHNLYILAHKLAKFNKELSLLLKSRDSLENEALAYYAAHTAQIEVILKKKIN